MATNQLYMSPQELYAELPKASAPFVIDVRPMEFYATGHIPVAHHIPGDTLAARLDEIPRDRPIVTY
jgi:rhodanese-related sulfurtransferase